MVLVQGQPEEVFALVTLRNASFWRFIFWAEPLSRAAWLGFCSTPTRKGFCTPQPSSFLSESFLRLDHPVFWNSLQQQSLVSHTCYLLPFFLPGT